MSLFHSILSQLEEKISKKNTENDAIAAVISAVLHTTITGSQIEIHTTTLRIKAASTVKMAITLNRDKLLQALQEAGFKINTIQ